MLGMMRYDATKTLAAISVPTLVVAGDRDSTTKPEASERIRTSVPGARLITLTPAKHLGLIEHHERYAQAVRGFAHATQSETQEVSVAGERRTLRNRRPRLRK
jgi:pimeloyl-ACP methyl ester carboxylesterase